MSDLPVQSITPHRLFDVLQKEYLICILRAKIYPIAKHSAYWDKLALQKKDKICFLKNKYSLLSIFDDDKILKLYEKIVYNDYGLPNFYYPNEKVKDSQMYWDVRNYFTEKSKIKFLNEFGKVTVGIIKVSNLDKKELCIDSDGLIYILNFDDVSRIL